MAEVDIGVAGDGGAGLAHGAYTWPPPLSNPDGPADDPGSPAGVAELEWWDAAASPGAGLASRFCGVVPDARRLWGVEKSGPPNE